MLSVPAGPSRAADGRPIASLPSWRGHAGGCDAGRARGRPTSWISPTSGFPRRSSYVPVSGRRVRCRRHARRGRARLPQGRGRGRPHRFRARRRRFRGTIRDCGAGRNRLSALRGASAPGGPVVARRLDRPAATDRRRRAEARAADARNAATDQDSLEPLMPASLKIGTWNVNGIRARLDQVQDWVLKERPDVFCLQEIKASPDQIPMFLCELEDYWCYWHGIEGLFRSGPARAQGALARAAGVCASGVRLREPDRDRPHAATRPWRRSTCPTAARTFPRRCSS